MPAQLEEITGVYMGEKVRFGDTAVSSIIRDNVTKEEKELGRRSVTTIKGPSEDGDLKSSITYRFYGRWQSYTNRRTQETEQQFHFQTFVKAIPHGRAGVINYLKQAPGIGQKVAERLWDKFQGDAVRVTRENPDVACAAVNAPYFGLAKAEEASKYLAEEQAMEGCTIDLIDALHGRGFPKMTARAAVVKWGNTAASIIKRCPYYLMAFRGCGFLKTDAMYIDLGLDPTKIRRQALCAWHSVASDSSGNTWHPVAHVERALTSKISGAALKPFEALRLAKRAKMIATRRDESDRLWIAERSDANNEERIAWYLAAAELEAARWPDLTEVAEASVHGKDRASEHQMERLATALQRTIAVLSGAPGTGKTFLAAALVKALVQTVGQAWVGVAAPTGKAAVRVTENLQKYGLQLRARTIHSMLGVRKKDSNEGWSFQHNEDDPLPYRFLIVDEASMIDNGLLASLLAARAKGCCILFVGDINQLPPVCRGAPLRDMITAGIPTGELTEIRRNSGAIVRACHAIKNDRPFETSRAIDLANEDPANLYLVASSHAEHQTERMFAGIAAGKSDGLNPVWDCQVIVAVNAKSDLGRKKLNQTLQARLNPAGEQAPGNPFRVGDKIVNLKNGFVDSDGQPDTNLDDEDLDTDEDGKVYVANGELAEVLRVEEKLTVARLSSPTRIVKIPRGLAKDEEDSKPADDSQSNTGCSWDLGYALSCHKSQGSEWPLVIVMLDEYPGARMVCSREWIYTAISRAKRLCLLVGKLGTAHSMCRKQALGLRKTFLVEQINEARQEATA